MLAAIPYTTFPQIDLGPVHLRTFGIMVGTGILVGAWVAARRLEREGITREETYSLATRMVLAGVVGARITWDITHHDQIGSPLDLIAVWNGGLQFSGGFLAAVAVGVPAFRRWTRLTRWRVLDAYAIGLTIGLAIGRIGCYSVGEHLGKASTSFPLAVRYDGGSTREGTPLVGQAIHNTSLYELLHLLVLFAILSWLLRRRERTPGTAIGVFCLWYGAWRLGTDFLRGYDEKVLGLTGAQWMSLALLVAAAWILLRVRPDNAELLAAEPVADGEEPVPVAEPEKPRTPDLRP